MSATQEKIVLNAEVRDTFGKKVNALRKDNILPANIYGKGFEPTAIKLNYLDFYHTFKKAGETTVVYVEVDGKTIPTLISDIQIHPLSRKILHADLRKVDLKKKIEAYVPIVIIGESEAVDQKHGVLITQMDRISIEALPTNIPHEIEIDISVLKEIGDEITVAAIPKSTTYEVMEDPERVIVSVTEHVEETIEVQTATEAPEILTEKAEEGEEAAGDAKKED
ncbi:50S ribosomal protein L25 [soil metagenome]